MYEDKVEFTPEMRKTHTIYVPMMLPIHFSMIAQIFNDNGYHVEILQNTSQEVIDEGLKNVHNDICYPALLVIGQMIEALKSGKCDPDKTAFMITQTGGGCRASNYIYLLRKALKNSGYGHIPVISLNLSNLEKNAGFRFTPGIIIKASFAVLYGDMLMCIANQCRPYELVKGDTQKTLDKWTKTISKQLKSTQFLQVKKNYRAILEDFAKIPRNDESKVKVGIVGEIYMKYSPLGNNSLEDFLVAEGAEPVVSGVMDFLLYCFSNRETDQKLYGIKHPANILAKLAVKYIEKRQEQIIRAIEEQGVFTPPSRFHELEDLVEDYIGKGAKMGEGWLLTAEMAELIHSGVNNIVCTQPFGCLPNHIVAKGMIRKLKDKNPQANIVAIDYDPSATKIHQENRLKLMLANARGQLQTQAQTKPSYEPHQAPIGKKIYI